MRNAMGRILLGILAATSCVYGAESNPNSNANSSAGGDTQAGTSGPLTQNQMVSGIKDLLSQGIEHAVASLGKADGFNKDASAKIQAPDGLQKIKDTLQLLGQNKLTQDFVGSMNHAAEQAAPKEGGILHNAVSRLEVPNAQSLLNSSNNAITAFFQRATESNLVARLRPIVAKEVDAAGVSQFYKNMVSAVDQRLNNSGSLGSELASGLDSALGVQQPSQKLTDVEGYVTKKTLDGFYAKIAEEEKRIRQDPSARTTDLLKRLFGGKQSASEIKPGA